MKPPLELAIIRKDCKQSGLFIAFFTLVLLVMVLMSRMGAGAPEDMRLLIGGAIFVASYFYSKQFHFERGSGTLRFLQDLPVRPWRVVLAKYLSVFWMTFFTVNFGAYLLGDMRILLSANAGALFLSALFMTPTVIAKLASFGSHIPFLIALSLALRGRQLVDIWLSADNTQNAFKALALVPALVLLGIVFFREE